MNLSLGGGGTSKLTDGGGIAREAWLVSSTEEAEIGREMKVNEIRTKRRKNALFTNCRPDHFLFLCREVGQRELQDEDSY
jgi:hypothetical protein